MTVIICAATNCVNNEGAICAKDEIKFALVKGSDVDLHCRDYVPRHDSGKVWRGNTHALQQDYTGKGSESVSSSHQK